MAAKILIVTGDAAESLEVLYPYQRLIEEGYDVHIAAPSRKRLRFVVHDFEPGFDTYTEKPGYTWPADLAFAEVDPGQYVALVIPGGRAPEYLRNETPFTGCDAGHTSLNVNPFGLATVCKVSREHPIPLLTAGVAGLARLGGIADRALQRQGACTGCTLQKKCTKCMPLVKMYRRADAPLNRYCQHA